MLIPRGFELAAARSSSSGSGTEEGRILSSTFASSVSAFSGEIYGL